MILTLSVATSLAFEPFHANTAVTVVRVKAMPLIFTRRACTGTHIYEVFKTIHTRICDMIILAVTLQTSLISSTHPFI